MTIDAGGPYILTSVLQCTIYDHIRRWNIHLNCCVLQFTNTSVHNVPPRLYRLYRGVVTFGPVWVRYGPCTAVLTVGLRHRVPTICVAWNAGRCVNIADVVFTPSRSWLYVRAIAGEGGHGMYIHIYRYVPF